MSRVATLDTDLALLRRGEPGNNEVPISFQLRMAVVYRSEKKKILLSQINLAVKVLQVLKRAESVLLDGNDRGETTDPSRAYLDLLLQETLNEAS